MTVIKKIVAAILTLVMVIGISACKNKAVVNDKWAPSDGKQIEELELWLTNSLDRVRKNRTSNGKNTITIAGARGEYESFQIVASTESENPIKLTGLTVSDFTDKNGNVIESDKYITLYREHYIETNVGDSKGAVICETVFSINGIGRLAVQAIEGRDIPLLQGTILFSTVIVIVGNLIADCLYSVLDPRIRKEV